jgi:hypothetical protein
VPEAAAEGKTEAELLLQAALLLLLLLAAALLLPVQPAGGSSSNLQVARPAAAAAVAAVQHSTGGVQQQQQLVVPYLGAPAPAAAAAPEQQPLLLAAAAVATQGVQHQGCQGVAAQQLQLLLLPRPVAVLPLLRPVDVQPLLLPAAAAAALPLLPQLPAGKLQLLQQQQQQRRQGLSLAASLVALGPVLLLLLAGTLPAGTVAAADLALRTAELAVHLAPCEAVQHQAVRLQERQLAVAHLAHPSRGTAAPPQPVTLLTDLQPAAAPPAHMLDLLLRWRGAVACAAARVLRLRRWRCCRGLPALL